MKTAGADAQTLLDALLASLAAATRSPEGVAEPVASLWTDADGQWRPLVAALQRACLSAPSASGSGIPRVMAVLSGEAPPAPPRVIPVKFLAGTLAIGSGLALGREGPTVQMGASIAYQTGKLFRQSWTDCRALLAAGAGAGFAVAFNAPIAGAVFVLEGLVKRFEARIAIAALAASAVATWVGRAIAGDAPEFSVGPLTENGVLKVV